jgi:hypothetical protein
VGILASEPLKISKDRHELLLIKAKETYQYFIRYFIRYVKVIFVPIMGDPVSTNDIGRQRYQTSCES